MKRHLLPALAVVAIVLSANAAHSPAPAHPRPAATQSPACPTEDANTTADGRDCFWLAPLGGRSFYVIGGHVVYVFGRSL